MRWKQLRYWLIAFITFFLITGGSLFQRVIAFTMCGLLGINSPVCYWLGDSRVNAAVPPASKDSTTIVAQDIDIFSPDGGSSPSPQTDIFAPSNPTRPQVGSPNGGNQNNSNGGNQNSNDDSQAIQYIRNEFKSPVHTFYINGIRTNMEGYAGSVDMVSTKLLNGIVDSPRIYKPTLNPTGLSLGAGDIVESALQSLPEGIHTPSGSNLINDIVETIKKVDKEESERAKKSCKDTLRAKFLLIGHSQGTYFVEDVATKLPKEIGERTVLFAIAPFTHFGKASPNIRAYYYLLREDDLPVVLQRLPGIAIPASGPNLPPLPSSVNQYKDTAGLARANYSHQLQNYLGEPTKPEYANDAQRALEKARANLGALLNFDSGKYEKKKDCPKTALKQGTSYGDPHLITFDGFRYSFQTVGEFTLVKSKDGQFEVQVRQGAVPGRQLSLNTGVAMKVGNTRVAFYSKDFPDSDTSTPLRIDGKPTVVQGGSLSLPSGGSINQEGSDYVVFFPTGEQVRVHKITVGGSQFMNISPAVPEQSGQYIGLLGNLNGNPEDDLQTRGGKVLPSKSTYGQIKQAIGNVLPTPLPLTQLENAFFEQLYKDFGNSWRISQAESLFDYPPGQTTDTFTDRSFPKTYMTLGSLLPPQIRQAEAICRQAGVEESLLEGCIFDVGNTGEAGFAQAAANALLDNVKNRAMDQIRNRVPVRIPGLPF